MRFWVLLFPVILTGKTLQRESVPVLSQVTVTVLEEESISRK